MNKKYVPIVIAALALILVVGTVVVMSSKKTNSTEKNTSQLPNTEVIPTVDSSVKIMLAYKDATKHDLKLDISNFPSGTESIEYELTYNTEARGLQGIPTSDPVDVSGKDSFSQTFFIGTQSSGAKSYDVIVGAVTLNLKFNGSYGAKSFEKDYNL